MERSGRPPIASSDRAFVSRPPPSPPPAAIVQLRPVHLVPAPQTALPASKHPEDRVPQRGTRSWRCGRQTFAVLGRATELASHFKHEARPAGPGGARFDCLLGTVSPPSTQNTRRSIILHSSRKKKQCLTKPKCKPCGPSLRAESIGCVSITLRVSSSDFSLVFQQIPLRMPALLHGFRVTNCAISLATVCPLCLERL